MKNKKLHFALLVFATLLAGLQQLRAQTDPHFTQHYTYPMYINPAMTGTSDGDYRVSSVFRSQWAGVGNAYRTVGLSFDTHAQQNLAVGINLMNQSAGDAGFNYFNTYASVAYSGVKFGADNRHRVVMALQAGLMNRRVDQTKFKWGEQWNPITGYNGANPTSEVFAATSATTLDMGAGILYYDAAPGRKSNVFGGASFFHINKPKDPIISSRGTNVNNIPLRFAIHGGVSFNLFERTSIVPHLLYMQQATARETMLGVYVQRNIDADTDIMFGGYYRHKDALAPFVGVDWKNFVFGLSYDINTSTLGAVSRNVNSFELSLSYVKRKGDKSIVDFIRCPRL